MEGKNGAMVAMDPRNGEILAMVSRPTFDPNDFSCEFHAVSGAVWSTIQTSPC